MSIQSAGRSFADMALSKNVIISGLLRDCKIFIPGPDLELHNVTGSVRISDGILEADGVSANLGASKGWNGKLRLGLESKAAPFHLDMALHTRAPELHAVLLKLVREETFRGELLKVQNVTGELSGRLILGERLNDISPVVTITKAEISAAYAPIPFPIAVRGGRFSYDQRLIRLENAEGSVGGSSFGGLGLTVYHDGSRQIKIGAGRVSLDLQQTDTLLRRFKDVRPQFAKLKSVRGQVELANLTLTGAYDDPARWKFTTAGAVKQVDLRHEDLPGPVTVTRGKFAANQSRIKFSDAAASVQDASLIIDGIYEGAIGAPLKLEISGSGTIGEQTTQWLSRQIELPQELLLRSPLKIITGQIAWRSGGDVSFRGKGIVAGGPQIFLDGERDSQNIIVRDLTVEDGDRHARVTLKFAKDNLDLSFDGTLGQQTLNRVFASWPSQAGSLQGEIEVSAALKKPLRFFARGQLEGSNFSVPWENDKALIEKFHIEAEGASVLIRSAALRWRNSRLGVSGKLAWGKEPLRMDLDVSADRLDWQELSDSFGIRDGQRKDKGNGVPFRPAVEGTIRLKTDRFKFERVNLSPLQMTAIISPSGVRAEIAQGVACGIEVTGRVDVAGKELDLDVQLAATEAQLEPTTVCLTNQQNDVTGVYSLKARVVGRGDREHLPQFLKGNFELSARNGEFVHSPGIDATFDYLNASGDFKVAFPDLDREVFPYRFVGVKGRIDGEMLVGDEINIESSLLNLSGQGKVDLVRKQIDGKVLIAVFKPVDDVISRMPVIGSIFGGSLVGIPVRVTGSLERPDITYLSPADVGVELLNIPLRILRMPLGAIRLFTPSGDGDLYHKDITQ
jgi:hypothetical protein